MDQLSIVEFNKSLMYTGKFDIIDYIKQINRLSNNPIEDLSFMDDLLKLIEVNECNIPHILLVKYGVISNNKDVSHNIMLLTKRYDFKENIDFRLVDINESKSGGRTHAKDYYLHPRAFKLCLMRSKNTKKYAHYYLLLEEAIKYYHDYQLMYSDHIISNQSNEIKLLRSDIQELKQQNLELISYAKDTKEDISILLDYSVEQTEIAEEAKLKTSIAVNDRINVPINDKDNEMLIVIEQFNNDYSYYVIRGIKSYTQIKFRTITGLSYKDRHVKHTSKHKFLCEFINVPNARHLFRAIKTYYTNIKLTYNLNNFNVNISKEELINTISEIFTDRLTVKLEEQDKQSIQSKTVKTIKSIQSKCRSI